VYSSSSRQRAPCFWLVHMNNRRNVDPMGFLRWPSGAEPRYEHYRSRLVSVARLVACLEHLLAGSGAVSVTQRISAV
jgi:hypothetical protein